MSQTTIGIDIGGTAMKAGLVRGDGAILHTADIATGVGRPPGAIIADMAELCRRVAHEGGVAMDDIPSIGFGVPGLADNRTGNIVHLTNLKWRWVPLRDIFRRLLDKPIYMENDANVAALAESTCGVSKDADSSVFMTLGTGLGGGLVIGHEIYSGAHGVGSEVGHMMVVTDEHARACNCGNSGCLERYASALALIEQAGLRMKDYPDSSLASLCGGDAEKLSSRIIFDEAKRGDLLAKSLFDEFVHYLSLGIVSLINVFDPAMFVLGGGISKAGAFLLDPVRAKVKEHIFYKDMPYGSIELAQLGSEAGIIGAAMVSRKALA